jgi:hypothetical protein
MSSVIDIYFEKGVIGPEDESELTLRIDYLEDENWLPSAESAQQKAAFSSPAPGNRSLSLGERKCRSPCRLRSNYGSETLYPLTVQVRVA